MPSEELEKLITAIDWRNVSVDERKLFAVSVTMSEISMVAQVQAGSAATSRFSLMVYGMALALIMTVFGASASHVVLAVIGLQLLLTAFSKLVQLGAEHTHKQTEKTTVELLKKLARQHPIAEKD